MDTTKAYFIKRANEHGILLVRQRNPKEDLTGWGALEFILNNGEVFVISGRPFGQGQGEDGLWVDMNALNEEYFSELRAKVAFRRPSQIDIQKSAKDYLSDRLKNIL
jgi:hypothetical protein